MSAEKANIGIGMLRKGATILSNQLGEMGNIRANNQKGNRRFELSSIWTRKGKVIEKRRGIMPSAGGR